MSKVDTITIAIVFAFAAFIVAGLAITPALQEASANELTLLKNTKNKDKNEGKPGKKNDFIIEEPIIELVKKKDKGPKNDKNDFIIDEPVIKLVKNNKDKNPNHKGGHQSNHDFIIDEPVVKLVKQKDKGPKKNRG